MDDRVFRGDVDSFEFTMPGVALGGPLLFAYSAEAKRWRVTYEADGRKWVGESESKVGAVLALIADRMAEDFAVPHAPHRGSDVEAWIKRHRDQFRPDQTDHLALDLALDDYRQHADTGTPLDQDPPDFPGHPDA